MPVTGHTAVLAPPIDLAPHVSEKTTSVACDFPRPATGHVPAHGSLHAAAEALLTAWDAAADDATRLDAIAVAVEAIRSHLAHRGASPDYARRVAGMGTSR